MFNFDILVDGAVKKHYHEGNIYIAAPSGRKFELVIKKYNYWNRYALSIGVDGKNIISGEDNTGTKNDRMYIMDSHQNILHINGWRKDDDTIAEFYFTHLSDGYNERIGGNSSSNGVISLTVFDEKDQYHGVILGANKRLTKSMSADIATGYGREKESHVRNVKFDVGKKVYEEIIYYSSEEELIKKGIIKKNNDLPNPFPGRNNGCPIPPGGSGRNYF